MPLHIRKRRLPIKRRSIGHKQHLHEQRQRIVGVAVASTLVLLVLALGAGFGYAWYSGKLPVKIQKTEAPTNNEPKAKIQPKTPDTTAVGVAVQLVTSPVAPGENTSVSMHTNPFATCTVDVDYDGQKSTDSGLKPKKADEFGIVSWTWTIEKTVPEGTYPATVTCKNKKTSGLAIAEIEVKLPKN